ncbi:MAG: hypothetical protein QW572_02935 [Candidatus Nitrosocaldus sp.]
MIEAKDRENSDGKKMMRVRKRITATTAVLVVALLTNIYLAAIAVVSSYIDLAYATQQGGRSSRNMQQPYYRERQL